MPRHFLFVNILVFASACTTSPADIQPSPDAPFVRSYLAPIWKTYATSAGASCVDVNGDKMTDLAVARMYHEGSTVFESADGLLGASQTPLVSAMSSGVTAADADNDGDVDLFFSQQAGQDNLLYLNDGAGGFSSIGAGDAESDGGDSYSAAWADYDRDGQVDLFVANQHGPDFLYRNAGGGRLVRVKEGAPSAHSSDSYSGAWADYDGDGDDDLFIANFSKDAPNSVFRNDGRGRFSAITEGAIVTDVAISAGGSWADIDNDGDLDLFVSNGGYSEADEQQSFLYKNLGEGQFERILDDPATAMPASGASVAFGDYDNDGDLDLFQAVYREENRLFWNDGNGRFTPSPGGGALSLNGYTVSANSCDFNGDGLLDLALTHWEGQGDLMLMNSSAPRSWIRLDLEGSKSNRSAIGAVVRAKAVIGGETVTQMRQVSALTGARSQSELTVHFGFADATIVDQIEIDWPSGETTTINDLKPNRTYKVIEQTGLVDEYEPADMSPVALQLLSAFQSGGLDAVDPIISERASAAPSSLDIEQIALVGGIIKGQAGGEAGRDYFELAAQHFPKSIMIAFRRAEAARSVGDGGAPELYAQVLSLFSKDQSLSPGERAWIERQSRRYSRQ